MQPRRLLSAIAESGAGSSATATPSVVRSAAEQELGEAPRRPSASQETGELFTRPAAAEATAPPRQPAGQYLQSSPSLQMPSTPNSLMAPQLTPSAKARGFQSHPALGAQHAPQLANSPAQVGSQQSTLDSEWDYSPQRRYTGERNVASSPSKHSAVSGSDLKSWEVANHPEVTPEAGRAAAASPQDIVLELCGEGVLDVPAEQRRIGPLSVVGRPLLVGRRHQPELHRRAVTKDCLQFLSRDHFQISWESGEFKMLALTSNPIWRDRDGTRAVELARGEVVPVMAGDRILLGTGADASVTEARRSLCWHLNFASSEDSAPAGEAYSRQEQSRSNSPGRQPRTRRALSGYGTPPSPGGVGPRVSVMPWAGNPSRGADSSQDFEALLPPADAYAPSPSRTRDNGYGGGSRYLDDPSPQSRDRANDRKGYGARGGGSSALRLPVQLDGLPEDAGNSEPWNSGNDQHDEFARSGFRY